MNLLTQMFGLKELDIETFKSVAANLGLAFKEHTVAMQEHSEALRIASMVNTELARVIAESGKND